MVAAGPSEPRIVYIAHESLGRSRFRLSWLRNDRAAANAIADALLNEPGIIEVRVRPFTGSALVLYDPRLTDGDRVRRAICVAAGIDAVTRPGEETPEQVRQILQGSHEEGSLFARTAAQAFHGLHVDFLKLTGGRLSLGSALAVALWTGGIAKLVGDGEIQLPEWHQMLWWGFRSFAELEEDTIDKVEARAIANQGNEKTRHDRDFDGANTFDHFGKEDS